jgi:hypothetical protein
MTRTNARRRAAIGRDLRRAGRRSADRQIRRGDYDAMSSGERMIRRTRQTGEGE